MRKTKKKVQSIKTFDFFHFSLRFQVIRSGLEPETYCLEGSCSIQLSYQTILFVCGCKVRHFFANRQIFDGKTYLR